MRLTIKMPKLADTTDEVYVVEWLCTVGQTVAAGDPLMSVETDKVDAEVPAPASGTVIELLVEPDSDVATGTPICVLETESRSE